MALLQMANDRVVDVDARHPVVAHELGRAHLEQRQVPLEPRFLLRLGLNAFESFVSSRLQSCYDVRRLDTVFEKALQFAKGHLARSLTDDAREALCNLDVWALEATLVLEASQAHGDICCRSVIEHAHQEVILGAARCRVIVNLLTERERHRGRASAFSAVVLMVRERKAAASTDCAALDLPWNVTHGVPWQLF